MQELIITDHALIRFAERALKLTNEQIMNVKISWIKSLIMEAYKSAKVRITHGLFKISEYDVLFRVREGCLVTVLPSDYKS